MSDTSNIFIHPSSVVDPPANIGNGTKIWHFCHVMAGASLGQNCSLGQNVFIANGVTVGNNVKIQNNVSLYTGVHCEDDVFLGPSMVFTNVINPRSGVIRKNEYQETYLEKGVSVGANATLVCGIRLGKFCFVGAGSVVTRSFSPYSLIVGNPGRLSGWMSEFGHKLKFNEKNFATCPESGQTYQLENNDVKRIS